MPVLTHSPRPLAGSKVSTRKIIARLLNVLFLAFVKLTLNVPIGVRLHGGLSEAGKTVMGYVQVIL